MRLFARNAPGRSSGSSGVPWPLAGAFAAIALLAPLSARAQAISVRPISVELTGGQRAAVVDVVNSGDKPAIIQVRAFAWAQPDGQDQLTPTNDLALSPPFTTIAAGKTQIVRVVLRAPKVDREADYRMLIDQVPPPGSPGVMLALRISIPVFVEPDSRARPKLAWRLLVGPDGRAELSVANTGTRRIRLSQIGVALPGKPPLSVARGSVAYLLPGVSRVWQVDSIGPLDGASSAHVTAATDQGALDADAVVASKP